METTDQIRHVMKVMEVSFILQVSSWQKFWVGLSGNWLHFFLPKHRTFGRRERDCVSEIPLVFNFTELLSFWFSLSLILILCLLRWNCSLRKRLVNWWISPILLFSCWTILVTRMYFNLRTASEVNCLSLVMWGLSLSEKRILACFGFQLFQTILVKWP